jgi:hypothetical protein
MDAYQHAARGLLADEVSSAAAIGLVNVSVEESFQVNEDAFHDRIIKVSESTPACPASSSAPGLPPPMEFHHFPRLLSDTRLDSLSPTDHTN